MESQKENEIQPNAQNQSGAIKSTENQDKKNFWKFWWTEWMKDVAKKWRKNLRNIVGNETCKKRICSAWFLFETEIHEFFSTINY